MSPRVAAPVTSRERCLSLLRSMERGLLADLETVQAGIAHLEDEREADQADLVFRAVMSVLSADGLAA